MENVTYRPFARVDARRFLQELMIRISDIDPAHGILISNNISKIRQLRLKEFDELLNIINSYFKGISPVVVAEDYMHMVEDMRREMKHFLMTGSYSCKSEAEAFEKVYSNASVMSYYMNALLISQLLWPHHFGMLQFFKKHIYKLLRYKYFHDVLEIGAGHGLYSWIVRNYHYCKVDIYDISDTALCMTKKMLGDTVNYTMNLTEKKYDLILLGEVIEHCDDPYSMIMKAAAMLFPGGILWISIPINAPAIDHVYLFRSEAEVYDMINYSRLKMIYKFEARADDLTKLIGVFCKR